MIWIEKKLLDDNDEKELEHRVLSYSAIIQKFKNCVKSIPRSAFVLNFMLQLTISISYDVFNPDIFITYNFLLPSSLSQTRYRLQICICKGHQ
jgi:hypothetical protein